VWQQYCIKKSFYGCSNYPECKFTLAEHFRKKKLTKTNVKRITGGKRNPGKRNQKQREKALQCRCKNWGKKGIY
jgi:DNA topoisomerase-3